MPGIPVAIQFRKALYQTRAKRVQVNVPHQLQKIGLLITKNRFVPILKQRAMASVAAIEGCGIPREKASHERRDSLRTASKKNVGMIGKQSPRVDGGRQFQRKRAQSGNEVLPVFSLPNDLSSFYSPDDDVV